MGVIWTHSSAGPLDVTICIGTFGDSAWPALARERAIPSAMAQGVRVVHAHSDCLHEARNVALEQVTTAWVVFLDADDELTPDYCRTLSLGAADLRVPSVKYVRPNGRPQPPYVPRVAGHRHECEASCLEAGNYAVIGSMANVALLRQVGGFRDEDCYEDWSAWLRMYRAGAIVETIREAVYVAHVRPESRNRALSMATKNRVHHEIIEALAA